MSVIARKLLTYRANTSDAVRVSSYETIREFGFASRTLSCVYYWTEFSLVLTEQIYVYMVQYGRLAQVQLSYCDRGAHERGTILVLEKLLVEAAAFRLVQVLEVERFEHTAGKVLKGFAHRSAAECSI